MGSGTSTTGNNTSASMWTDPRTGLQFATEAIGRALGYGQTPDRVAFAQQPIVIPASGSSPGGMDYRDRDAYGELTTNQKGSQFWMDAGFKGEEPSMQIKAMVSQADYARDWLGEYSRTITSPLASNAMLEIQKYPTTLGSAEIWANVPQLNPSNGVSYKTASSSPGSENEPAYVGKETNAAENHGLLGGSNPTTGASGIGNLIMNNLILILGAGALILFLVLAVPSMVKGKGARS